MSSRQAELLVIQGLIERARTGVAAKQYARAEKALSDAFGKMEGLKTKPEQSADLEGEAYQATMLNDVATCAQFDTQEYREQALRAFLEENLYGQPEAIEAGVQAYLRSVAPIKRPDQPLAVIMSLGQSRTGKSELPRLMAEYLHGDRRALVRVDLSQYQEDFQISTLIGSPPGYVGYSEPAKFSREILARSRADSRNKQIIVVLEEIEKAHRAVADVLLGVFDNGEAQLANGETADFRDVIIFMTSNLAASELSQLGKTYYGFSGGGGSPTMKQMLAEVNRALAKHYRPEFLNRIDSIVLYRELDDESLRKILRREVKFLGQQVKDIRQAELVVDETAEQFLLKSARLNAELASDGKAAGSAVAELKRLVTQDLMTGINRIVASPPRGHFRIVVSHSGGDPDLEFAVEPSGAKVKSKGDNSLPETGTNIGRGDQELAQISAELFNVAGELARQMRQRGQHERALAIQVKSCELDVSTVQTEQAVEAFLMVARVYAAQRGFALAESHYNKAEELASSDSGLQLRVVDELADFLEKRSKHKTALEKLSKLRQLEDTVYGAELARTAGTHARVGSCRHALREFTDALKEFRSAIDLLKPESEANKLKRATVLCKMSQTYRALHQMEAALLATDEAVSLLHDLAPCQVHVKVTEERAALIAADGRYREAKTLYEKAMDLRQALSCSDSLEAAAGLAGLAMCCFGLRQLDAAAGWLEKSAYIYRDKRCIRTAEGVQVLVKLSGVYQLQGKLVESVALADGVQEIEGEADNGFVPESSRLLTMALECESNEEFDEAERLYDRLMDLLRSSRPGTPSLVAVYARLMDLARRRKLKNESELHFKRAQDLMKEMFGSRKGSQMIWETCKLAQAFVLLGKDNWAESLYIFALALAEREGRPDEERMVCQSYSWLLNDIGRYHDYLRITARAARVLRKRKVKRLPCDLFDTKL